MAFAWIAVHGDGGGNSGYANNQDEQHRAELRRLNNPRLYDPHCDKPESAEEADLCAQRDMAEAARGLYHLTLGQLIVGALGLGALLWTLYYARVTASEARRSANAAIDAAEAAARAVDVQTRADGPFLHIQRIRMFLDTAVVHPEVRNSGKSPAILISASVECLIGRSSFLGDPVYMNVRSLDGTIVEAGKSSPLFGSAFDGNEVRPLVPEECAIAWGRVVYEDVYGNRRCLGFGFACETWFDPQSYDSAGRPNPPEPIWVRAGGMAYNYDIQEPKA